MGSHGTGVKALPAVRAMAKKMKVDLAHVTPTGADGTITFDDVKRASQQVTTTVTTTASHPIGNDPAVAGLFEPLRGVRRTMATVMLKSHQEVVPVTLVDDADITSWAGKDDYSVRIIKAIVAACQKEPALNAWFDGQRSARRVFQEVNVGLAMDTEEGLFVPLIEQAQDKSPQDLRKAIDELKVMVQNRTIPPEKLQGASIVLSNFGKFAGRYATPIVVPPTVAIIGVGALKEAPCIQDGKLVVGKILPLSLTFDHRAVTGGEATRFLGHMLQALQSPH